MTEITLDRYDSEIHPREQELEKQIYRREMDSATNSVLQFARQPRNEERYIFNEHVF